MYVCVYIYICSGQVNVGKEYYFVTVPFYTHRLKQIQSSFRGVVRTMTVALHLNVKFHIIIYCFYYIGIFFR